MLQEKLRWCYHKEGVNHYEVCKDLAVSYLELLKVRRGGLGDATLRCVPLLQTRVFTHSLTPASRLGPTTS